MALTLAARLKEAAQARLADKALATEKAMREMDAGATPDQLNARSVQPFGTTIRYNQTVQPEIPNGTTKQFNQSNQAVQPSGTTTQCNQLVQPSGAGLKEPNLTQGKTRRLTKQQQLVLDYLTRQGPHVTDKSIISEALGIAPFTARNILIRLTELKIIERKRVGQGMRVAVIDKQATKVTWYNQTVQPNSTTEQYNHPSSKIDRLKTLSISQERIESTWPNLSAAGFGAHQIEQIIAALDELGKPVDKVVQSLDHAEWELDNGKMLDKAGRPVADPCSWVFRALARTGYYRRPAGYVSAEEQAAKDAEVEARAVSAAHQKADQARFEAWRDSLSQEEMGNALQGHPGGNKEAWLKRVWKGTS